MKRLLLLLALVLILTTAPALAQNKGAYMRADLLLSDCKDYVRIVDSGGKVPDDGIDAGVCVGFLEGALDMVVALKAQVGKQFCPHGDAMTMAQVVKIYVKYMDDHPEELDNNQAAETALKAMRQAFPCPK